MLLGGLAILAFGWGPSLYRAEELRSNVSKPLRPASNTSRVSPLVPIRPDDVTSRRAADVSDRTPSQAPISSIATPNCSFDVTVSDGRSGYKAVATYNAREDELVLEGLQGETEQRIANLSHDPPKLDRSNWLTVRYVNMKVDVWHRPLAQASRCPVGEPARQCFGLSRTARRTGRGASDRLNRARRRFLAIVIGDTDREWPAPIPSTKMTVATRIS